MNLKSCIITFTNMENDDLSTTSTITEKLYQFVLKECRVGDRIPSEAALAEFYGVSRVTIRESIKILAGRGLLSLARGRRAIVQEPDSQIFGEFLEAVMRQDAKGKFDLLEVRQILEIQSAALAAQKSTTAGLMAMENAYNGMIVATGRLMQDPDDEAAQGSFHDHDVAFHAAIALSSGNRLLAHMLEAIAKPLRSTLILSASGRQLRGVSLNNTNEGHLNILTSIQKKDRKAASIAMARHLDDAQDDLNSALMGRN